MKNTPEALTGSPLRAGRKEWIGLIILFLPTLLVSIDFTVTYLAVPSISAALRPGSSQLLWITDIYGFLQAGLVMVMGTLGDRIGRRRILLIGALAFAIASTGAAFSTSAGMLIAFRALLGVAGATLLPSTISLIRNMFHDDTQRSFAIGAYTTCFSTGTILGPLAGGLLIGHFWWGSVFLMSVPIMIILLVTGPLLLPEYKNEKAGRFDLYSALLLIIATLSLIYGIKRIAENGLGWMPFTAIGTGLAIGIVFIRRQRRLPDPLIDLRLFRDPAFNAALLSLLLGLFCWAGVLLFTTQYLQLILGMTPFTAGLWTVPGAAGSIVGCMIAPNLPRFMSRGTALTIGLALITAALLILIPMTGPYGFTLLITATVLLTLGCSTIVTLGIDLVVTTAPPERAGEAAGISETSTGFGSALGIAIMGSVGTIIYRSHMGLAVLATLSPEQAKAAKGTLGGALNIAGSLHGPASTALLDAAHAAFGQSFRLTAAAIAVFMLLMTILLGRLMKTAGSVSPGRHP